MASLCPLTQGCVTALRERRWTREFVEHLAGCNSCNDALFMAFFRDQKKVAMNAANLTSSESIWWLAALERQRRAVRRPELAVYQVATLTCWLGAVATAALLLTRDSVVIGAVAALLALVSLSEILSRRWSSLNFRGETHE